MTISLIVAMDQNALIGQEGKLPWHLPADLAYFKKTTTDHMVIMGRKTFESIGRPLPDRNNVVLTTNQDFQAAGIKVVHTIEEAVSLAKNQSQEVFVIGGAEIYAKFIPMAEKLYITLVSGDYQGEVYFPDLRREEWICIWQKGSLEEDNCMFLVYHRKKTAKISLKHQFA